MNTNDLKALIYMAQYAGLTTLAQLQRIALKRGVKNNNELLLLANSLYDRQRAQLLNI